MKDTKQYIIDNWGENWLRSEWMPGDVIDALEEFTQQQCQKQLREKDIEAWFYQKGMDTRFAHELYEYLKQKGLPL